MTLNAAAHSLPARLSADRALVAALAIAFIAADTLAGAWFFQLVLDIRPCPLCLEQRYAYYLAVPLGLLVAFQREQKVFEKNRSAGSGGCDSNVLRRMVRQAGLRREP